MGNKFNNNANMGRQVLRFLNNSTDVKKICQYCGKPANLKNNKYSPYNIQLVCIDCRKVHKINPITEMYDDIPLIDLYDHVTSSIIKNRLVKLDSEYINKIRKILKGGYNKTEAIKYLNVTSTTYKNLIKQYKERIDKNIEIKLKKVYKKTQASKIRNNTLSHRVNNKYNNISKIKMDKNISNNVIYKRTNGKLTNCTISNVINGKTIPKNTTCALLAKALECNVTDIFPEYTEFENVKGLQSLKYRMMKTYTQILFLWLYGNDETFSKFLIRLGSEVGVSFEVLRNFIVSTKNDINCIKLDTLSHETIKNIAEKFKSIKEVEFPISRLTAVEDWKKRMIPRKKH